MWILCRPIVCTIHRWPRGQASVCPSPWVPSRAAPRQAESTPRPARRASRRRAAPPRPIQAPSHPGSRRSGPDAGNPEMLEFALSQEMARTASLFPPVEGREENPEFCFILFRPLSVHSGTHFLKERAISFSSRFSGPWDDSVRRPASSLSPTTHFCQQPREYGSGTMYLPTHLWPVPFGT